MRDATLGWGSIVVPCILISDRRMRRAPFLSWFDDPVDHTELGRVQAGAGTEHALMHLQDAACRL